jgi:transposase
MATLPENCTRQKQRSVIRFLWSEEVKLREIHRRMIQQYDGSCTCMSERKVYQWVERFQEGRTSVVDEHRSGRPCTAISDVNVADVDALIGEISVDTVATLLNISVGSARDIIHETLKYRCVPGGC